MTVMVLGIQITLVTIVTLAAWSDLRTRRIPNWITAPGAVLGFALQAWYGGPHAALASIAGAGLGLGLFLALHLLGGMGAGDVKLFGAVGAFTGPQALVIVFVLTGLLGGVAAILLSAFRGRLRETFARSGELLADLARLRVKDARETSAAAGASALRLPYGVVIACGTLASLMVIH